MLTKIALKEFVSYLKNVQYKNVLRVLKLEYCTDDDNTVFLHLNIIKIKKPFQCKGYGSQIMSDIVRFANNNNVRIELYASTIFGSELQRLYKFYSKFGFTKVVNDKDHKMIYNVLIKKRTNEHNISIKTIVYAK
jgi:GNAT superfamily N-acetyltransferase